MFAKFGSKRHLNHERRQFATGINHGAIVRLDNKRNSEATVIASNSERSLIDFGANREWYANSRLWVKVA